MAAGGVGSESGGRGRGGMVDPSNLHLKKELTQIRKAARVLRDPGTSSSWRSPATAAASPTKHHYAHHQKTMLRGPIDGNAISPSAELFSQRPFSVEVNANAIVSNASAGNDKYNINMKLKEKEKHKRVFLYNWRSNKSESDTSKQIGEDDVENSKNVGISSYQDEIVAAEMRDDGRDGSGNDSKSDTFSSDRCASAIFRCKDTRFSPAIRRAIKKKSKRSNYSNRRLSNYNEKIRNLASLRGGKEKVADGSPGLSLGRYDVASLVDRSDDTEDFCNSEDVRMASRFSPLLSKLKSKAWDHSHSSKLLKSQKRGRDSISYSTSSYNKQGITNPSTLESWDATTGSVNDADDEVDDQLDFSEGRGCGIPCYWSRRSTPKSRMSCRSYSPSLSDTLRRKGSSVFYGSRTTCQRRRHRSTSDFSSKRRPISYAGAQSPLPLLTYSGDGRGGVSSAGSGSSDNEISTNFGELDLEALSRLDGKRWSSSCRNQEGLELASVNGENSPENVRSLTHKYRPMFFEEVIGQDIVIQSLASAITRGRISNVYLFQGPRGTGKTSTARILAAALNCLVAGEVKPCGVCRECFDFISGKSRYLIEANGSNKKGMEKIKDILQNLAIAHPATTSRQKVFIIDECHLLPSKTWMDFLRFLEKLPPHFVFILVTTEIDNVPKTLLSRCQKHLFSKISNVDIVKRLKKISSEESFDVEMDALHLIASNSDGSLRDAETMLDQLSLFGKRISTSLVNELIGVVSDEKLLELLELAMSSNATETVVRSREMMDSGVDPALLMSQMAALIVDIIAGTYPSGDLHNVSFLAGRRLSEREVNRLKHALTILSDAEKHLKLSTERSTWFTATLLQLGSMPSPNQTNSESSRRQSSHTTEEDQTHILREAASQKQRANAAFDAEKMASPSSFMEAAIHCHSTSKENAVSLTGATSFDSSASQIPFISGEALNHSRDEFTSGRSSSRDVNSNMLSEIWFQCIEKCHSKTLQQLLHSHGKLLSITAVKGGFVAQIAFGDGNLKARAEGFLSSITNSFEMVLRRHVEVKITFLPDPVSVKKMERNIARSSEKNKSMRSNMSEPQQNTPFESVSGNADTRISIEMSSEIPGRRIESMIHEQRLETAWLQAMERGTPGPVSRLKPERNQILPQDGMYNPSDMKQWDDELNHEIKALKIKDEMLQRKEETVKRIDHCPISPSLLHNSSFSRDFNEEKMDYDSGSGAGAGAGGCSALFCWKNTKSRRKGKAKKGITVPMDARRSRQFSFFGECGKSRLPNKRESIR